MKFYRLLLLLLSLDGVSSFAVHGIGRPSTRTILARNSQENDDNNSGSKNNPSSNKGGSSNKKEGSSGNSGSKSNGGTNSDGSPRRRSSPEGDPLPFVSNLGKEPPRGGRPPSGQAPRNVSPPMPRPGERGPRAGPPPPPGPGATWDPRSRIADNVSATPPGGVDIGLPSDRGFTRIGVPGESPSQRKRFDFARGVTEDIFQGPPRTGPYDQSNDPRQNGPYPGNSGPSRENGAYPRPDMGDRGRPPGNQNYNGGIPQDDGYSDNRTGQRKPLIVQDADAVFNPADPIKGVRIKETNSWSDNSSNFHRGDSLRGARIPNDSYDRGFDASFGPGGPGPYGREPYMDPRQDPRQGGYGGQRPGEYGSRPGRYARDVDDKYASWPAAKGPRTGQAGYTRDSDPQQNNANGPRMEQPGYGRGNNGSQQYGAQGPRTQQTGYGQNYDSQQYGARGPGAQQGGYGRDLDAQRYNNGLRQGEYGYGQNMDSQRYQNGPPRDNYYRGMPPPYNGMYPSGRQDAYNNYNHPPPQRFGYDNRNYGYQDQMGYGGRGPPYDGFWQPDTYRSDLGAPGSYSSWRSPLSPDDKDSRKAPWDWSS